MASPSWLTAPAWSLGYDVDGRPAEFSIRDPAAAEYPWAAAPPTAVRAWSSCPNVPAGWLMNPTAMTPAISTHSTSLSAAPWNACLMNTLNTAHAVVAPSSGQNRLLARAPTAE